MSAVMDDEMYEDDDEGEVLFSPMSDDELVNFCLNEISGGIGGSASGDHEESISTPLDYYLGRLPGISGSKAKDPNASRFVSMDLMDAVEASTAEIMPTFTTDQIAFYEPEDERDEDQSRTESEVVNYLFMEEYDGYTMLQVALKDCFLHRNCTVKAYWDERQYVTYRTYEDVPEMALEMILQPEEENQVVEIMEQEITEEANPEQANMIHEATMADPMSAAEAAQSPEAQQEIQAAMMAAQAKYTIKIKRTTTKGRPKLESLPPEQVIVSGGHNSPFLHKCRFVAHENLETQSSLIEQGYDPEIVKELSAYNADIDGLSRSRATDDQSKEANHASVRTIRVYECYPLVDFDGDGIAERRKVVISGNKILANDEWNEVPLIGGVAIVMPHKYSGVSMFDRLREIQDSKTPIIRSIVDGTQLSSNPRVGVVTGEVNLDDLLTSRTGGIVRMDNPNSIVNIPNPEIPQSSYGMLQYMDSVRSERGGSAITSSSQAQAVSGDTAHGIERVMSAMEMNNAVIARTLGETLIRGIFIQLHTLIRENYTGELKAKIGGKWITTMPSEWKERTSVSVQIGSSHAERARQAGVIEKVVAAQAQLAAQGSVMFTEAKAYTALTDAVNLSGVKNPDRYFTDPESDEGQQANQQKQQQSQQEMQKQQELEQQMLKAQNDLAMAEILKGQAALQSQQVKFKNDQLQAQLKEAQMMLTQLKDTNKQSFEYDQLLVDAALKLTELEVNAAKDLSAQYEGNKR
jgi:hypothetical protein